MGTGVDGQGRASWYLDPSAPAQAITINTGSPSGGLFGFLVPAGLTSASLDVGTGPGPSVYYQGPDDYAATQESVNSYTPAAFKISFPAASLASTATKPPSLARSGSAPTLPNGVSQGVATPSTVQLDQPASASGRHSGQGWWPIGVATGAGTTIIVVAGLVISRRTRLIEAKPVTAEEGASPEAGAMHNGATGTNGGSPEVVVLADDESGASVGSLEGASQTSLPRLKVAVLGPLVVEGTGDIRRKVVLRALVVLALFLGRPIGPEELRGWLADG